MKKGLQSLEFSFEADGLTHYGGLFLIQRFCNKLGFRPRLQRLWRAAPDWSEFNPVDMIGVEQNSHPKLDGQRGLSAVAAPGLQPRPLVQAPLSAGGKTQNHRRDVASSALSRNFMVGGHF